MLAESAEQSDVVNLRVLRLPRYDRVKLALIPSPVKQKNVVTSDWIALHPIDGRGRVLLADSAQCGLGDALAA